jgi:hypothetical protein
MGAGAVALLFTLIDMFTDNPSGYSGVGVSTGASWGGYLAVLVSIAIIVSGYLMQSEPATA